MEIKVLSNEKDEIKLEISSLTIAEILRTYLSKDEAVAFAAWKREHINKSPVLLVKTKGKSADKAVKDAISKIEKDADKIVDSLKKGK